MALTKTKSDPLLGSEWVQLSLFSEGVIASAGESRHIANMVTRLLPSIYKGVQMGDARMTIYFSNGFICEATGPRQWLPKTKEG